MKKLFHLPKGSRHQQQRQRQIESLKSARPAVVEVQKDVEYKIPFTVDQSTISVTVLLPPHFPREKPVVTVDPPLDHHLVDSSNGIMVSSPLISNFGVDSDLGQVIEKLLDEFWKSPPALMSARPEGIPHLFKASGTAPYPTGSFDRDRSHVGPGQTLPPVPMAHPEVQWAPRAPAPYGFIFDLPLPVPTVDSQAGQCGHMYKMPEIPEFFPELYDMEQTKLSEMYRNEDVLLDFFVTLPQFKQVTADREELVANIVDMAKMNLQMEPRLEDKRQEMLDKREHLSQRQMEYDAKMEKQSELRTSCSLSSLQARLKAEARQAERESEETVESFLQGRTDINQFLTSFMEKRTLCHSRWAKEEKLQQFIKTQEQFHLCLLPKSLPDEAKRFLS